MNTFFLFLENYGDTRMAGSVSPFSHDKKVRWGKSRFPLSSIHWLSMVGRIPFSSSVLTYFMMESEEGIVERFPIGTLEELS